MRRWKIVLLLTVAPLAAFVACSSGSTDSGTGADARTSGQPTTSASGKSSALLAASTASADAGTPPVFQCSGFGAPSITFGPTVPPDLKSIGNQSNADCFAWSELVALSWPVSGASF